MTGIERRKQRLTWEAIGSHDPALPQVDRLLRAIAIVGVVLFVLAFASTYPA